MEKGTTQTSVQEPISLFKWAAILQQPHAFMLSKFCVAWRGMFVLCLFILESNKKPINLCILESFFIPCLTWQIVICHHEYPVSSQFEHTASALWPHIVTIVWAHSGYAFSSLWPYIVTTSWVSGELMVRSLCVMSHVFLGLPTPLFPCGFHSSACLVTFSGLLRRRVWPIQPHFLLHISWPISSCFVFSHKLKFEVLPGNLMCRM